MRADLFQSLSKGHTGGYRCLQADDDDVDDYDDGDDDDEEDDDADYFSAAPWSYNDLLSPALAT